MTIRSGLRALGTAAVLALAAASSAAAQGRVDTIICPLGGELFDVPAERPREQAGLRLDLRPIDRDDVPLDAQFAQCPGNGFVIYRTSFTDEELETLAGVVESERYQAARATQPTAALAMMLDQALGEDDPAVLAYFALRAAWQTEDTPDDPAHLAALDEAITLMIESLDGVADPNEQLMTFLVIANLHRRAGRFQEATRLLIPIPNTVPDAPLIGAARQHLQELITLETREPAPMPVIVTE